MCGVCAVCGVYVQCVYVFSVCVYGVCSVRAVCEVFVQCVRSLCSVWGVCVCVCLCVGVGVFVRALDRQIERIITFSIIYWGACESMDVKMCVGVWVCVRKCENVRVSINRGNENFSKNNKMDCKYCGKTLATRYSLERHVENLHKEVDIIKGDDDDEESMQVSDDDEQASSDDDDDDDDVNNDAPMHDIKTTKPWPLGEPSWMKFLVKMSSQHCLPTKLKRWRS